MKNPSTDPHQVLEDPASWAGEDIPFIPWGEGRELLAQYISLLLKWNKALNLTGCHTARVFMAELAQDSFQLAKLLENFPAIKETWDLGAGAGIPGIPLRIFWKAGNYTMVERNQKRCAFLANALGQLNLTNATFWEGSVENFFAHKTTCADAIVSRAFMPWPQLLAVCAPWLKTGGALLVMANNPIEDPLPPGWRLLNQISYRLPAKIRWIWTLTRDTHHDLQA